MCRYRSVASIVAIPLLLFAAVFFLMPGGESDFQAEFSRSQPFSRNHYESGGSSTPKTQFAIVIDAGSTGSRVHIFKFTYKKTGTLELNFDEFQQLKPGLSSYPDDPQAAANSLAPLVDLALKTVPKDQQSSTPIMVGATAGLRLLPGNKADVILAEVRTWLRQFPFTFKDDDVKILSGVDEGAFAWLTLNYLLGKLGGPHSKTVAAIDLGGGSVQEAFAMSQEEAKAAPKADYITKLRGGGQEYTVYVYSYLGYGLMAGRAAVLSEDPNGPQDDSHPCVAKGYSGKYEYGGKTIPAIGHDQGAKHGECISTVLTALKNDAKCGAPQKQCSFGGAWGGPRVPSIFYVSSYFFDRAHEAGLITDAEANEAMVAPRHFKDIAKKACDLHVDHVETQFPRVQEPHRPYFCLDLTYAHTILTHGFKIAEEKEVTLVKRVKYKNEFIEAAWPLGAAINMLG